MALADTFAPRAGLRTAFLIIDTVSVPDGRLLAAVKYPGETLSPEAAVARDLEANGAALLGIRAIPTLMVFRDGILVFSQVGALPEEALQVLAGRVKDLDMDRVRAEVAAHAKMQN